MTDHSDVVAALTGLRPDQFEDVARALATHADEAGCGLEVPGLAAARAEAALAAAARATYVLVVGDESIYPAFQVASTFGPTGRIDMVVSDPAHAKIAEDATGRHALSEWIRVHLGRPSEVVPSFNGPFDLIVYGPDLATLAPQYEDVIRLVRSGGTLLLRAPELPPMEPGEGETHDVTASRALARRLAIDDRLVTSFGAVANAVLAVRRR